MKIIIKKTITLIILALTVFTVNAQWSTPISLGNGLFKSLASGDSFVHMANGSGTITYRRSIDEGTTWSSPTTIGNGTIYLDRPICMDGLNVYIVYFRDFVTVTDWCCPRNLGNMYMRKSNDGGATWQPEIQLTTTQGGYRVGIISAGSNVYLTWMDFRSGTTWDLYFRKSTDGGVTWQPEYVLVAGNNSVGAERPDIVVKDSTVHVLWMSAFNNLPPCYTMPNCSEVFYKRSLDYGTSWGPDTKLNTTPAYAARPIATLTGSNTVIVSWEGEDGTGENEPYTRRSTDNGTTWDSVQQWRNLLGEASHQFVASLGGTVHLAWHDERDSANKEIYYRASNDSGATFAAEELVSNAPGESAVPILGTTTNYVHAIWSDDRSGSSKPWYSRRGISATTSVPNVSNLLTNLKVYPNPAQEIFTVEFSHENYDLIITDLTGRNIFEKKNVSGQTEISSKDFPNGIYFIEATSNKVRIKIKKLISIIK